MRAAARCADALAISISLSAVSDFSDLLLLLSCSGRLSRSRHPLAQTRSSWILVLLFHPASARLASIRPAVCVSASGLRRRTTTAEGRLLMLLRTVLVGLLRVPLAIPSSCDVV